MTAGGTGRLKVGVSNIRSRVLMPYVMGQFRRSMPGVNVRLIEGTNEELQQLAERGSADIVIARFGGTHPGVTVRRLFQEEVVLTMTPALLEEVAGMPVEQAIERAGEDLSVLAECPFLLTSLDDITGRIARSELRAAGIKPRVAVEGDSLMALLSLCREGIGAVFCPANVLDAVEELSRDLVRVRLSDAARYDISLGRPASADPWAPAQVFEDIVGALFAG